MEQFIEIKIGGYPVKVDKSFLSLPPEQQEAQVNEIYQNMLADGYKFGVDKQMEDWSRSRPIASKAAKLLQGIPFIGEYTDEAVGYAANKLFGRNQQEATNMVRAMQDREGRENPGQSLALQMGGGVAATLPAAVIGGPAKLTSMLPTSTAGRVAVGVPVGAGLGAAEGGVSGYGRGTTPESRIENAKEDAKVGGVFGGAFGAATPLVGSAIRGGAKRLMAEDAYQANARRLGLSRPAASILERAMPDESVGRHNIRSAGDDAMLADAGGGAQIALDAALSRSSGAINQVRPVINQRASDATGKMTGALNAYLGQPQNVNNAIRDIRDATKTQRKAIYNNAYASPIDYSSPDGMRLEGLLQQVPNDVIAQANRLMKIMGEESKQIVAKVADDGTVQFAQMPDVRQWDYITRALNTLSQKDRGDALGAVTAEGMGLSNLSRDIRNTLRNHVDAYDKALKTAADPLSRIEALKVGEDALRPSVKRGDFAMMIEEMGQPQLLAVRRGVRQYIDDQMAKAVGTLSGGPAEISEGRKLLRDLSSRQSREKLQTLMGDAQAARLFKSIDEQAKAFELRASVAVNSKTAQRQEFNDMLTDQARGGAIRKAASGEPIAATKRLIQVLTDNTPEAAKMREDAVAQQVAQALTTARGRDAERLFNALSRIRNRTQIDEQLAADVARIISVPSAAAGYTYATNSQQMPVSEGLLGR